MGIYSFGKSVGGWRRDAKQLDEEMEQVLDGHLDPWTHEKPNSMLCGCVKAFEVYFCGQFDVIPFFMAEKTDNESNSNIRSSPPIYSIVSPNGVK